VVRLKSAYTFGISFAFAGLLSPGFKGAARFDQLCALSPVISVLLICFGHASVVCGINVLGRV